MNKSKGFTLVEMLAVIVILAIVLAIAVPRILSLTQSSTVSAFISNAKLILRQLDLSRQEDNTFDPTTINETNLSTLKMDNSNYTSLRVRMYGIEPYVYIVGKDKWNGYVACGTYMTLQVVSSANTTDCFDVGNQPVLATGMTPVKWVDGVEQNTTSNDPSWYDYSKKLWANAKTADGSYWVWIPRYAYKLINGYQSSTAGIFDIKFLNGTTNNAIDGVPVDTTPTYSGNSQNNYVLHPAFTFGTTDLTGIWVSKFEASDNGSGKVKIVPNVASWRSLTVKQMYDNSRDMETNTIYGWNNSGTGIDTHMMKNTEWGAAAYLSKSSYGINDEIWINPANNYTTGCAGNSVSSGQTTGCLNAYNTVSGINASTTRNITGIYDMSGGAWEYVMGNLNNLAGSSGLTPANIPDKYIDRYAAANNGYSASKFGDAYYETSYNPYINGVGNTNGAWYGDYSYTPESTYPWFLRGGSCLDGAFAGAFDFYRYTGGAFSYGGFRPALLVASGL